MDVWRNSFVHMAKLQLLPSVDAWANLFNSLGSESVISGPVCTSANICWEGFWVVMNCSSKVPQALLNASSGDVSRDKRQALWTIAKASPSVLALRRSSHWDAWRGWIWTTSLSRASFQERYKRVPFPCPFVYNALHVGQANFLVLECLINFLYYNYLMIIII